MFLVLGLGNPGRKYERTRHNVGFLVVDRLAERSRTSIDGRQFKALVGKARIREESVILVKPQTYMNLSGEAAVSLRGYYKVDNDRIITVHDDVDLPFGDVRVKRGGGHGGHNGLRDLSSRLGGGDFLRVRVGVSRPPPGWDTADYVLGVFSSDESAQLDGVVDRAADAVEAILGEGVAAAMNTINASRSGRGAGAGPASGASGVGSP